MSRWHVIGFTSDEIVCAYQDARMADECVTAWHSAGSSSACRIVEAVGEGEHLIHWFVNDEAAAMLDARGVQWHERIIAERAELPAEHQDLLDGGRGR